MHYTFTKEQENTVGQKAGDKLAEAMMDAEGVDFTLARVYEIVCREPQPDLSPTQMHSRCSRALGDARARVKTKGYVLVQGALRHSYRAVKRTYSHTPTR